MIFTRPDQVNKPLYVISPIYNPIRYRSRWKLYKDFARMVKHSGAKLMTVEIAFGNREHVFSDLEDQDYYVPLRIYDELWIKECAINIGFTKLPADWEYAAWIDGDVHFVRGDWANDTVHQLQHYPIVQMFSESVDLSPQQEILDKFKGYIYCYNNGVPRRNLGEKGDSYYPGNYWHPGYAWAIRKNAFNQLGGLIDFTILGGGDYYMANALCDQMTYYPKSLGWVGINWMKIWKDRADKYIKQNVGFVDGLILHHFHGKKKDRRYSDRGSILTNAKFSPDIDLKRDSQGLYQLNPDNVKLREGIRKYMRMRSEDSIDI